MIDKNRRSENTEKPLASLKKLAYIFSFEQITN